jgi:hypothetical protein
MGSFPETVGGHGRSQERNHDMAIIEFAALGEEAGGQQLWNKNQTGA